MPNFSVKFDSPMTSVQAAGENYRVSLSSETASAPASEIARRQDSAGAVSATTTAIEAALKDVLTQLSMQRQTLQSAAANYAVEIVRVFLNSTDEIIEQRLRENVIRVLDEPDPCSVATIFVHPSCREEIHQWLLNDTCIGIDECELKVMPDDQLTPGDCRVDFGHSGRVALFEEQLKLVSARLQQSIREGGPA